MRGPLSALERSDSRLTLKEGKLLLGRAPFTGETVERFPGGRVRLLERYRDGLKEGTQTAWYSDGSKAAEWHYREGLREGLQEGWHPDGKRRFLSTYHADLPQGVITEWHPNGALYRQQTYVKGEEVSQKIWRPSGQIYANYVKKGARNFGLPGGKLCDPVVDGTRGK
jgi:antitoxin component YwqK of YwqJK toxin-antitoxin module